MAPLVTFRKVSFSYDSVPVLHNFSFSVSKGEKAAVKGESGSGKTTFFRLLLGFERPGSGTILYNGREIAEDNFATVRGDTAWLPQDLNIGNGSVKEVILRPFEFGLNSSSKPDPGRISNVVNALGLDDSLLENPFRELSTGQRQRIGLALCYLLDRPLLLLDEPTSALDKVSKQKAVDLLFSGRDRTVISTSHDPFWLEQCDRVISLD